MRVVKVLAAMALLLIVAFAALVYVRYGGGRPYPDLTTAPRLPASALETVLEFDEPIGNVAVAPDGRVFFTVHPESRPEVNRLMVWNHGRIHPYPDLAYQSRLRTPLGTAIAAGRLWVIDSGHHGFAPVRLVAFDLASNQPALDYTFSSDVAPLGSFLQDLQIDRAGRFVYIADVSFWRQAPGIVVFDAANQTAWRALTGHPSVLPQNWLIRTAIKPMRFFGGLATLKPGVDGIALSKDDRWVYYGAMANDTLYKVSAALLQQPAASDAERAASVVAIGPKPLNDGLSMDIDGNVFLTDVEHSAVLRANDAGELVTLVRNPVMRWPDALSFGPDGWLYVADSAIPEQMLRSKAHIRARAPYGIYRFQPGTQGVAGQ